MKLQFLIPVVFLCACTSTSGGGNNSSSKEEGKISISRALTTIDLQLRTWNNALLGEPTEENVKLVTAAENTIGDTARERFDELVRETEYGSSRNRLIATAVLGFSKDERALPYLVRAMNAEDPQIASNALMSLGVLASPATPIPSVLDALSHNPDPQVRNQAAFVLVRICGRAPQDPELLSALRKALRDPEPGVRAQAAAALGKMKDVGAQQELGELLHDTKPLIAAAAAFALGQIGDPKSKDSLVDAMESSSPRVRDAAHRALIAIFGKDRGARSWDWKSSP